MEIDRRRLMASTLGAALSAVPASSIAATSDAASAFIRRLKTAAPPALADALNRLFEAAAKAGLPLTRDGPFDGVYFALHDAESSLLNLVDDQWALSRVGEPRIRPLRSFQGDGVRSYFSTGLNVARTSRLRLKRDSCSLGVWCLTDSTREDAGDVGVYSLRLNVKGRGGVYARCASEEVGAFPVTDGTGSTMVSRTTTGEYACYKNGENLGTRASPSAPHAAQPITIGRAASNFSSREIAAVWFGAGLTAAQAKVWHDIVSDFIDACAAIRRPSPSLRDASPSLADLAASQGILYGSALRETDDVWKPKHAAFLKRNVALYVPGTAALPDHVQPSEGVFTLDPLKRFVSRAQQDGKAFRIHCLLYPGRDRPWVSQSLTPANWRLKMRAHFSAIRSVPGIEHASNIDVVNEVVSAAFAVNGGYRPTPWMNAAGGAQYIVEAFKIARDLWPSTPLYFCQDQSEQISDDWRRRHTRYILNALESALKAGAPIDGYNAQSHLTLNAGFSAEALSEFLTAVTKTLGLKLIVGELDVRSGFSAKTMPGARPASAYTEPSYDKAAADYAKRYLDVVLPFLSGKQIITWGVTDLDSSWRGLETPGERPLPWDVAYRPKPLYRAIYNALADHGNS